MVEGEVKFRTVTADPNKVRMFVREVDDSAYPSRVCVEMTRDEAILMFHSMMVEFPFLYYKDVTTGADMCAQDAVRQSYDDARRDTSQFRNS